MGNKICFDNDWKWILGDLSPHEPTDGWGGAKARAYDFGAAAYDFDDSEWKSIDIPHDFVIEGDYTKKAPHDDQMQNIPEMGSIDSRHFAAGCLESGVAWYRKRFEIPKEMESRRVYIFFDGVYRNSTVYLNQYYIGNHASGYSGFYYDITDFVNYGGENIIAVRVDARGREGWWYEGGGIYRHVWLEYKDSIAFEPYSVFVNAVPDLQNGTADINISLTAENYRLDKAKATVTAQIQDANGNDVGNAQESINISAWDSCRLSLNVMLKSAHLWDLESPYMYNAAVRIYSDGTLCDEENISFGIRKLDFDADTGFYLNGKSVRIKGLCLHYDHAGVGIGIPEDIHRYRINQLKSIGANAIRSSHYPAAPELLDICDREGMLVFEETRRMSSAPEDLECLKSMVIRGRNHPCVFLWGIGNEEIFSQHRPEMARATVTMKALINRLDGTRPVTAAVVCWDGKERFSTAQAYIPVTKNLDIMGFNYCKTAWDDYHERVPNQPVIITEASSNSWTRGCYESDESISQYYIYDADNEQKIKCAKKAVKKDVAEDEWAYFAERPYLSGIFLWTGMDYRGEPTPLTYPAVYSQFGIFDYCGFPKDNSYYYKAWWSDEPVLHIFPHWNHTNGEKISVYCYSNLDEVELLVNGKSYGKKTIIKNRYLTWDNVIYEDGEVCARGFKNGSIALTKTVQTTGSAYKIEMSPYSPSTNVGDVVIITVKINDKNGLLVPTADNEIHFEIENGKFIGTGNGNPCSHESDKLPTRRAFNGLCMLLVRADQKGKMVIRAAAEGIEAAKLTIIAE